MKKLVIQINQAAYKEALSAVKKNGGQSVEIEVLIRDLENKYNRFLEVVAKNKPLPLSSTPYLRLTEDLPVSK